MLGQLLHPALPAIPAFPAVQKALPTLAKPLPLRILAKRGYRLSYGLMAVAVAATGVVATFTLKGPVARWSIFGPLVGGVGLFLLLMVAEMLVLASRFPRATRLTFDRLEAVFIEESGMIARLSESDPDDLAERGRFMRLHAQASQGFAAAAGIFGLISTSSAPLMQAWARSGRAAAAYDMAQYALPCFAMGACLGALWLIEQARRQLRLARLYEEAALRTQRRALPPQEADAKQDRRDLCDDHLTLGSAPDRVLLKSRHAKKTRRAVRGRVWRAKRARP